MVSCHGIIRGNVALETGIFLVVGFLICRLGKSYFAFSIRLRMEISHFEFYCNKPINMGDSRVFALNGKRRGKARWRIFLGDLGGISFGDSPASIRSIVVFL